MAKGEWYRWNKKPTVENVPKLDMRQLNSALKRHGTLIVGMLENRSVYQILVEDDSFKLASHNQSIKISRTSCNYGGERLWFICPNCTRKCALLYDLGGIYNCRKCHGLRYQSQCENEIDLALRKVRKIRSALYASHDLSEPICQKPMGMHWRTFERLKASENKANMSCLAAMAENLGMTV